MTVSLTQPVSQSKMLINFDQLLNMFGNVQQFYAIDKYTGVCKCTKNQVVKVNFAIHKNVLCRTLTVTPLNMDVSFLKRCSIPKYDRIITKYGNLTYQLQVALEPYQDGVPSGVLSTVHQNERTTSPSVSR